MIDVADMIKSASKIEANKPVKPKANIWDSPMLLGYPDDVETWTNKDFVRYYAEAYERIKGVAYVIQWREDITQFKMLRASFLKIGYTKKEDTKKFIDWCRKNKSTVLQYCQNFMIHDLKRLVNIYLQDIDTSHLTAVTRDKEDNFLVRLQEKAGSSSTAELLMTYGLPIVATYLCGILKDRARVSNILKNAINNLYKAQQIESLYAIAKQSINMSPYPEAFYALAWREYEVWSLIKADRQTWWRKADNAGAPYPHYDDMSALLT